MTLKARAFVRLDKSLFEEVREIAKRRHVTITALVEEGLRQVVEHDKAERERAMDAEQI